MPDRSWMHQAACRGMDTEIWFIESEAAHDLAKSICVRCPVRDACLQAAIEIPGTFGVWGGKTKRQRTVIARGVPRQRKTHCIRGHEFTEDNTRISPTNGQRVCLACEQIRLAQHRDRKRASGASKLNAHKTHCTHGHEFTPENTGRTKTGKRFCRECQRDRVRRFRQRQREAS